MSHFTKDLKANKLLPEPELWRFSKMKKLPPKCPYCKKRLVEVFENEYNTYVFDPLLGTYKKHDWKGEIEISCPYCNAKLYDVFPDGVCNYVPRSRQMSIE
jgi:uncharacterized protein with PIN domain